MIPVFNIFEKTISIYMIMAAVGFIVTLFVMYKWAEKTKLDEFHVLYMILFSGIGVFVGGHLLYGLTNIDTLITLCKNLDKVTSFEMLMKYLGMIFGGGVFYGGMLGAILVGIIYIKVRKIDRDEYLNFTVISIPLFHIFGRIGCFLSGCCFGVEWEYGFTYHYASVQTANGVPRFPVQLVEAFINVIIFFVLVYIYTKTKHKYKVFDIYLLTYGVCRFILEYFRGDEYRGFFLSLSTSQWISIILVGYAVVRLAILFTKERKQT